MVIHCKFPKWLRGSECVNYVKDIQYVIYDVFFELHPINQSVSMPTSLEWEFVSEMLSDRLESSVLDRRLTTTISHMTDNDDDGATIKYTLLALSIYLDSSTDVSVIDDLLGIDGDLVTNGRTETTFRMKLSHWYENPSHPMDTRNENEIVPLKTVNTLQVRFIIPEKSTSLTVFNKCPHVVLKMDDVSIELESGGFYIDEYHSLVSFNDIYMHEDDVILCLETIVHLLNSSNLQKDDPPFPMIIIREVTKNTTEVIVQAVNISRAVNVLSFVCLLFSVICSLLTLVTYFLFSELRTQPGINNMILASSMVLWQTLFLVGFNQADTASTSACVAMGILIHYTWLLFLVWMHICSLHMFRVFWKNQTMATSFNVPKTTLLYMTYCALLASIPVVVNMIISSAKGQGIGYGGDFCYIAASDYFLYITSIPLCIVVIVNIALYIAVVIRIENTRSKVKKRSEQNSLISVYVKLSSLTGVTWIFGIVYMFVGLEWAEYVFVLLNGTQGIFIFVAFTINRRIFGLYKGLLGKHKHTLTRVGSRLKHMTSRTVTYNVSWERTESSATV